MCLELNAHAIITLILLLRDYYDEDKANLPWLLGSQTYEKAFRLARSMTSTFSMHHHKLQDTGVNEAITQATTAVTTTS